MDLPQMHSYDSRFDIDSNTDRVIEQGDSVAVTLPDYQRDIALRVEGK
jgi:hypothetical protein